jgi:hypothetical protein
MVWTGDGTVPKEAPNAIDARAAPPEVAAATRRIGIVTPACFLAVLIDLRGTGHYIQWGFIQISVANLVVILLMIAVFVLAIFLPLPRHGGRDR